MQVRCSDTGHHARDNCTDEVSSETYEAVKRGRKRKQDSLNAEDVSKSNKAGDYGYVLMCFFDWSLFRL